MNDVGINSCARKLALDITEIQHGKISYKDLATARRLSTYSFGNISDGHIDRVGALAAKRG